MEKIIFINRNSELILDFISFRKDFHFPKEAHRKNDAKIMRKHKMMKEIMGYYHKQKKSLFFALYFL